MSGKAFYFGLQIHFTRDRHPIFLPEAGKNWCEEETCCCTLAGIKIIVFTWKNYSGECQRERCNHNKLQLRKCAKSSPYIAQELLTLILKYKDSCSRSKVSNAYMGGQMKILSILTHFIRAFINSVAF